jgi:hypothetical protein
MLKINTGIAAEFIAAAELARRDFSVAITLGNTKKIDLLVEKNGISRQIQVKGIKQRRNNNFRISVDSLDQNCWYVFVNVNRVDVSLTYEFAILNYNDVIMNLRRTLEENDNAVRTNVLDNPLYRNMWCRFDIL